MDYFPKIVSNAKSNVSAHIDEATMKYGSRLFSRYKRHKLVFAPLFLCTTFLKKHTPYPYIGCKANMIEMIFVIESLSSLLVYGSYHNLLTAGGERLLFLSINANK